MKTIRSEKGKLVIEIDSQDRKLVSCLFSIISTDTGTPTPWWGTEDGTGQPVMDEQKFEDLWERWNALTDVPEAKAYFSGEST